jgi:hypothetical protein
VKRGQRGGQRGDRGNRGGKRGQAKRERTRTRVICSITINCFDCKNKYSSTQLK